MNAEPSRAQVFLTVHLPAIALGLGNGIALPVIPVLANSFGVSVGVASLVFIAQIAGALIGTIPTGYAADRFGRKKILLVGPIILAAASFLVATAGTFQELLIYRFIAGWGSQMWMLGRVTMIADTGRQRSRGQQITSMFGAQRVGTLIGPLVGGFTATLWGYQIPFVIQGVVVLLAVAPSLFVVSESHDPTGGKSQAGASTFRWRDLCIPPIPALFTAQYFASVARGGVEGGGVLFIYAVYQYGADAATLGILSSVMAGASIPIALSAGVVMDRFGRKRVIVPGAAALGISMTGMATTAFWSLPFEAFILGFISLQIAVSFMLGSMQTLGADVAPSHARGRFFGASRLVGTSGRISSPGAFAVLSELAGFGPAFFVLAGSAFVSAAVINFLVKETLDPD